MDRSPLPHGEHRENARVETLRWWLLTACGAALVGGSGCVARSGNDSPGPSGLISPSTVFVQVNTTRDFSVDIGETFEVQNWELRMGGSPCAAQVCGRLLNLGARSVTYEAPASVPAPDGKVTLTAFPNGLNSSTANITVTANPVVTRTLDVRATNAPGGTRAATTPRDNNGRGGTGNAEAPPFTYAYDDGVDVTVQVPVVGVPFALWTGCDSVTGAPPSTCHVKMTANRTVTARYGPMVTGVAPAAAVEGAQLTGVQFSGVNLMMPLTVAVTAPNGAAAAGLLTVSNIVVQGSTGMTADVTVDPNAPIGSYALTVTTPQGTADPVAFDVSSGAAPRDCGQAGTVHPTSITSSERWTAAGSPHFVSGTLLVTNGATLTVDPGSLVCLGFDAEMQFLHGASLTAGGPGPVVVFTAQGGPFQPWAALTFLETPAHASAIANARIEMAQGTRTSANGAAIQTDDTHTLSVTDSLIQQFTNTGLEILSPGSGVARSTIDGSGSTPGHAAVITKGASISSRVRNAQLGVDVIGSSVTLSDCEIIDSVQMGVRVGFFGRVTGTTITNCNLVNNGAPPSFGPTPVFAPFGDAVLAQRNWWGPSGPPPLTPNIDASSPLGAPVVLGY